MIPLVAPTITERDRDAVARTNLKDDTDVGRFEEAFAERVGCGWAVAVSSGTAALSLAFRLLGFSDIDGRGVWLPTYACRALLDALPRGVYLNFGDSRYDVRNAKMNQDDADITVHMFGRATDISSGMIEDYTLSLGHDIDLLGNLGVCSTHASKMISTGRGGVVFGNDARLERPTRRVATRSGVLMAAAQAALGVSQLSQLDGFIERRRELARFYSERFTKAGIECPDPDCGSVFFRYIIGVQDPAGKVAELAKHGIEAGRGVHPLLHQGFGLPDSEFPGAVESWNRNLSVPCHPGVTDEKARRIAAAVIEVCA